MHGASRTIALFLWALSGALSPAWAFRPAEDKSGPLTLRIEGPAEVTQAGEPVTFRAMLENSGDQTLTGHVRLSGIDDWQVEPAEAAPFRVEAKGKTTVEFTAVAGEATYSALYPLHAHADVEPAGGDKGDGLHLHAILVVEARLARAPRAVVPVEWKPVVVPPDSGLSLCRLDVRRVIVRVNGKPPQTLPPGWSGVEPATRCTVQPGETIARGAARDAIGMHPPYHSGPGTVAVEYPLELPANQPIRLTFGNAIRDHHPEAGEPASDGVTFRVRVLPIDAAPGAFGEILYEKTTDAKTWVDGQVDLSPFAGKQVRVQLESHPGPKNNTACDQSYWAEPTVIAGTLPKAAPFPPAPEASSRLIGRVPFGEGTCAVRVWPGARGLLDAAVEFAAGEKRLMFNGFQVRVLGARLSDPASSIALVAASEEPAGEAYRVRHKFAGAAGGFDVVGELRVESGVLRAVFRLENGPAPQPWRVARLEDVAVGSWSEQAKRVYAGQGNVIVEPEAFSLGFDGHRLSTSFVGFDFGDIKIVQAVDNPPDHLAVDPKSRAYSLHVPHDQTMTLIASDDVWAAAMKWREVNGLRPAGGVAKLGGKFVFDLWGGRYAELDSALKRAFHYGLTDSVVVMHNWQRWGYDYRLPDIYPPNPGYGTFEEFRTLAETCVKADVLFAPHDNYIDYYPDAEGYSYRHIAFREDGTPIKAWFNPGPKAQSYRWRTHDVWEPLKRNIGFIREGYPATAYFIDVWSSIGPYDEWSWDGRFTSRVEVARTWGEAFAWIRDQLGDNAPQISESGHDQLIGRLDGAQTNHLRVAQPAEAERAQWMAWVIACADAERIPWLDAAHHDRFVLHGAGYPNRYPGGLDAKAHGVYSDDYICTEMLTGHPAMVSHAFGRDTVRKYWLMHDVGKALALRPMTRFEFVGDDIHRQQVRWGDSGEVWANRGTTEWNGGGHLLPAYGFFASVSTGDGTVSAAIERQDAGVVEWALSPRSLYLNARPEANGASAWATCGAVSTSGACRVDVDNGALRVTPLPESAKFTVRLDWGKLPWKLSRPTAVEAVDEQGRPAARAEIVRHGEEIEITCEPGVFAYRFVR